MFLTFISKKTALNNNSLCHYHYSCGVDYSFERFYTVDLYSYTWCERPLIQILLLLLDSFETFILRVNK